MSRAPAAAGRGLRSARTDVRRVRGRPSLRDPDWLVQRHLYRDVRAALASHARGTLLDLGCGERPYAADLPPGVRTVGVDLPGPASRADVWSGASALPFASGAFETVLCTQVLEHVPDPGAVVSEAARVLVPGGRLILTAPQAWFLHEAPHDYQRFTRFGLAALCERAGLAPLEIRAQGGFFAMAGVFLAAHLGSYVRWAVSRGAGADARWRRWLAPLELPLVAANAVFAALDAIPHPGLFSVNHLLVAEKRGSA